MNDSDGERESADLSAEICFRNGSVEIDDDPTRASEHHSPQPVERAPGRARREGFGVLVDPIGNILRRLTRQFRQRLWRHAIRIAVAAHEARTGCANENKLADPLGPEPRYVADDLARRARVRDHGEALEIERSEDFGEVVGEQAVVQPAGIGRPAMPAAVIGDGAQIPVTECDHDLAPEI